MEKSYSSSVDNLCFLEYSESLDAHKDFAFWILEEEKKLKLISYNQKHLSKNTTCLGNSLLL
jgi:hypothetical protein